MKTENGQKQTYGNFADVGYANFTDLGRPDIIADIVYVLKWNKQLLEKSSVNVVPIFWALFFIFATPAGADQLLGNWQRGDLIFQETVGPEAEMLKSLTGSRLTHVGVLRLSGGGPIVVEATQQIDVLETDIGEFLQRGVGQNYAIYRIKGLNPPKDWYHSLVLSTTEYFNYPYDVFYRRNEEAIYSSELIHLGAKAIGIELGKYQRLGDLNAKSLQVRTFFLDSWPEHPECKADKLNMEECWSLIKGQLIITPDSLARDKKLELIVSTFDNDK